ncbi:hypothetical protein NG798_23225 [Ancylothrix sp. C2]|uniref:hypothetical protein n=1 Tax=Ancylothrix sp. D3o TaxID=2953691 RepID=UPI0021BB2099|nr:hypothetical protein [Ancylothrix sp. D3o]MCT7952716.1 hypothetical protein [Ancylothrix sp. D3o]
MNSDGKNLSPRGGFGGLVDRFVGPGATKAELLLQFVPALVAMVATPAYALTLRVQWTQLQLGFMALLAFDLVGGVLTNATSTAKRWYHRPGQGLRQHLTFVSIHLIHVLLVALLFRGGDWGFWFGTSGYLLGASVLILGSPLYLQCPVALGLYGLSLLGNCYLVSPTPGLEWFLPFFFLKIMVSHLLPETPYYTDTFQDFHQD